MSENPYQAPAVSEVSAPVESLSEAAVVRQAHLKHEASLKGMGTLFFLGGAFSALVFVPMLLTPISGMDRGIGAPELLVMLMFAGVCVLQFVTWSGLRKLRPWSLIRAAIISVIALFALGLGTLISIYFLYLLFSAKGRFILSPAYAEIMAQTPGMKYRTPMRNWIILGILLAIVIGAVVYLSISV